MDKKTAKRIIIDTLKFYLYKMEKDDCDMEDIVAVAEALGKDVNVRGTIKEFAEFYGQSESNIRNVIARRPQPKSEAPQRKVTYRFGWFSSLVPSSWKATKES